MNRASSHRFFFLIDRWIFATFPASSTNLAVYRIFYATSGLLLGPPYATWLGDVPQAFFSPHVSLAAFFVDFPPGWIAVLLNIMLTGFLSLLLAGWHTRVASLGTGLTLIVLKSFEYSIGKINHDILIVLPPLVLAFSNWGEALSFDSRRRPAKSSTTEEGQWPLTLLALLIAVAMFTAGWAKLASGWLDLGNSSTYGQLMANYWIAERVPAAAELAVTLGPHPLWEFADWSATMLELAFVVAMFNARAWLATLAVACFFHASVWLVFDILFETNLVPYAAFVSYGGAIAGSRFGERLLGVLSRIRTLAPLSFYPWAGFVISLIAITLGQPPAALLRLPLGEILVVAGALVGAAYLARMVSAAWRRH